ncbi:MAG: DMT family transporter, partial [Rhodospirillaceae bacterium]
FWKILYLVGVCVKPIGMHGKTAALTDRSVSVRPELCDGVVGSAEGIVLMLTSMALFSVMDGVSKGLSGSYSPIEVNWGRYFFHSLFLIPVFLHAGGTAVLVSSVPLLQVARGVLLAGSGVLFMTALSHLPLADATAIGFVAPLIVTVLSIPVLGERVTAGQWLALVAGFGGVVLVIRPGGAGFGWFSLLPVASAGFWALSLILTRRLAAFDSSLTTLFYTAIAALAVSSLLVPTVWLAPDSAGWLKMAALGALSALGQYLVIRAFAVAGAAVLAPFQYSQIVWSTTIGYAWFATFPDNTALLGTVVVIGSGLWLWLRERRAVASVPVPSL